MTKTASTALVCVLLGLTTACTTLHPVAVDATGERIRAEVKAGDRVRVVTTDGAIHDLHVTPVGMSALTGEAVKTWHGGSDAAGAPVELPYRDIKQVEVQSVSGGKTAALVAVVGVAAWVAIASGGGSHTPGFNR